MKRSGLAHSDVITLGAIALLGVWLAHPSLAWALAAGAVGLASTVLALRRRQWIVGAAAIAAILGAVSAARTTTVVKRVEGDWDGVRESLITGAGARLAATLGNAVDVARNLANRAVALGSEPRGRALDDLNAAAFRGDAPERGVAVFDGRGQLWGWGGRHRVAPQPDGPPLSARMTPFYVLLEARRQGPNGESVVADVLLDADPAIPDRGETVAARFAKATGAALAFYTPGHAPNLADVFDYCLPACSDTTVVPDTLFSVRLVPPSQGAYKLAMVERGGRWAAAAIITGLVLMLLAGGTLTRAITLLLGVGVGAVSPIGADIGLGQAFSPATFFSAALGPLSASVGALLLCGAAALVGAAAIWRLAGRRRPVGAALGVVVVPGVVVLLARLAGGITVPADGGGTLLWLGWELGLTLVIGAGLAVAAALLGGWRERAVPAWISLLAFASAMAVAAGGLTLWHPGASWWSLYPYVWIIPFALAVLPAPRPRTVAVIAAVAGTSAATLTWGAVVGGRLGLADGDVAGLEQAGDPVAAGLLERLGPRLQEDAVPRTAADLYARWSRSALGTQHYPTVLDSWSPDGTLEAQLNLANLDLPIPLLQETARSAAEHREAVLSELDRVPGTHYVLAVPYADGSVVTVGVGPRSRVIPPVRVAQFLGGQAARPAPYDLNMSEPMVGEATPSSKTLRWRRDGWTVRGEARLDVLGGQRHLHARVALGSPSQLLVRGTLVLALDGAVLLLLWLGGEGLAGAEVLTVLRRVRETLSLGSFRTRLALALAIFFVVPTVVFAAWTAGRLTVEAEGSRDLIIRQTLQDAAGSARELTTVSQPLARQLLGDLGSRLGTDLVLYNGPALLQTSTPVLTEMGLLDAFVPPDVFRTLISRDELQVTVDQRIAGRPTRVGYQSLGMPTDRAAVLAAPRLVNDTELAAGERDLAYGLVLATLLGLAAAGALASIAARSLARPVQALRGAALRVARGDAAGLLAERTPTEFVPVTEAFERMARDVAASRAALEAQRQRTAAVLRNVATGVVALDERMIVVTSNLRAEELLGLVITAGDAIMAMTPPEWEPMWAWVRAVARGERDGEPREFTVEGHEIRVQIAALTGAATGWVVALDDTTELSRAVRVLAWGELARQIAHQIKNPLTPIRLGIQHLARSYAAPRGDFRTTLEQTSRQMLAEIERLDAIARAFSRFGAPPAGTEPLTRVDVGAVARDTAALYALSDEAGGSVRAEGAATALARRDELKEVLVNLVENARTAGARTITITVGPMEGGGAVLAVRDDGRGIAPEVLPRVFEPQFSTTTSGSGLGLAICQRLVESWGGAIVLESAPERGTTVRITFPPATPA